MIGHPDARREKTPQGWLYEDAHNQSMALYLMLRGADLVALDEFIERLEAEHVPAGEELRARRRKAYGIFCAVPPRGRADSAFGGYIEWIQLRKTEIERTEAAQPYVDDGLRKRSGDQNRTKKIVRLKKQEAAENADRDKQIYDAVTELQAREIPGAAAKVAKKYGLSTSRVNNIMTEIRKKE